MENALRRLSGSTLRERNFTYTIIGPSLFFENDEKVKEPLLFARKWVEPLGEIGASRVAVKDVAYAVEVAILDRGKKWAGKHINIGTLKKYTVSLSCLRLRERSTIDLYTREKKAHFSGARHLVSPYLLSRAMQRA